MPTGYNYYAITDLYIGTTHAFGPGALVPDTTVATQGWVTGTDVNPIGTPPPTPQSLTYRGVPADGNTVVWNQTSGTWVPTNGGNVAPSGVIRGCALLSFGNSYLAYTGNAEVPYIDRLKWVVGPWLAGNYGNAGMLAADMASFMYGTFTAVRQGTGATTRSTATAAGTFGPSAFLGGVVILDIPRNDAGLDGTTALSGTTAKSRAGFQNGLHAAVSLIRAGSKVENNATTTASLGFTNGSNVVTYASAAANMIGMAITAAGVPANSYIGTVSVGVSFTMVTLPGGVTARNFTGTTGSVSATFGFVSRAGTWTTSASTNCSGGSISSTSTNGDTVKYVVNVTAAGAAQWVTLGLDDANVGQVGATYSISVDGGAAITGTTSNQSRKTGHTPPNASFGQLAVDLGTLTVGWHVIVVTNTGTTGTGFLYDDCAQLSTTTPPTGLLLKAPQLSTAGYAAAYPSVGASWTTDQIYNGYIDAEVAKYSNLEVISWDPNAYVDPTLGAWNNATMIGNADGLQVHLNDRGNDFYFRGILSALNALPDRQGLNRI